MNELRLYAATGIDDLWGYNPANRTLGGTYTPLYDFDTFNSMGVLVEDNSILLDGSGSGTSDMSFLVPTSTFGPLNPATTYVYLYSKFGDITGLGVGPEYQAQDGFEHWTIAATAQSPLVDLSVNKTDFPDPATPGGSISYAITVTNNAVAGRDPITVDTILLQDTFPSVLSNIVFTPSIGTYNSLTGIWSGVDLASGREHHHDGDRRTSSPKADH